MNDDQLSATKMSDNSFGHSCLKVLSSFCVFTQPFGPPQPIPSSEQQLSALPCSTIMSREEDSNPRDASSAVYDLPTADTKSEQNSRDALGESAHRVDVCDYQGGANEDVGP